MSMDPEINVFGEPIVSCSESPLTGFFRDGCCNTSDDDMGSHTVCIEVTDDFVRGTFEGAMWSYETNEPVQVSDGVIRAQRLDF